MTTYRTIPFTERFDAANHDDGSIHVLIRVERNTKTGQITETLVDNPASWGNCQQRWARQDAAKRELSYSDHELHYKVRSADDPAVAKLLRLYTSPIHAAQALVRRAGVSRWRVGDALFPEVRWGGWHSLTRELRSHGYVGTLRDGRAYLTTAGKQAADAIANPKGL